MTDKQLQDIRDQLAAATEGPWTAEPDGGMNSFSFRIVQAYAERLRREAGTTTTARYRYHALVDNPANATLIARAPYNLKVLLDEVDRLKSALEAVVAACPRECTPTSYCGVCEPAYAGLAGM